MFKAWTCAACALVATLVAGLAPAAAATVIVPRLQEPVQLGPPNAYSDGAGPEVAFDGTRFFVVWFDHTAVRGAFLNTDGEVIAPPGVITIASEDGWRPSVSWDGSNYLVAWRGAASTVLAKRVSPTGAVLDAAPIVVANDVKQRRIGLAFDGTRHLAVWRSEGDVIRGARISTQGAPLDGEFGFKIGDGFYPAVESAGGKFLVTWHAHGSGLDIVGSLVSNGTPGAQFDIANELLDQDHQMLATNGTDYLVVFKDRRYGDALNFSGTSAVRVKGDGTVLDDPPLQVSAHQWSQGSIPNVAWDGTNWVVAWSEDKIPTKHRVVDTYLRRVSTAGAIVDADPVPIGTGFFHQLDPTIAVAGNRYLAILLDRGDCEYPVACLNVWLLDRVPGTPPVPPAAGPPQPEVGSWQHMSATVPTAEDVHGVWAISDSLAYASTEEAGAGFNQNPLLRWNGSTWSIAAIQPNARKWDVWAPKENRVFSAGGAGGTWVLWDGVEANVSGNLFLDETTPFHGQAMAIRGFGEWNTFAAGSNGSVSRHFGSDPVQWRHGACLTVDEQPHSYWGQYDCDFIRRGFGIWDIGGVYPDDVYVVGEHATMARFDGTDWSLVGGLPTQHSLNGVYAACAGDMFAVGDWGTILRRQGGVWSRMGSPTAEHLTAVAGFGPDDVYAVGYGGTILHFDGTTWSPESSGVTSLLEDVGVGGSTVWAVGAPHAGHGTILRKQRVIADTAAPRNPQLRSRTHTLGAWTPSSNLRIEMEGGCDDGRGIAGYSVVLDHAATTVPDQVQDLDRGTQYFAQTVADGEWYFHLRTVDRAGNWSAPAHLGPLRVDTVAPTAPPNPVSQPAPHGWGNDGITVDWDASTDATSGLAGYSYTVAYGHADDPPLVPTVGPGVTQFEGSFADGFWFFHLKAVDKAGNASDTIHIGPLGLDTVAPANPAASSYSHSIGVASPKNVIGVELAAPAPDLSGVQGLSYSFSQDPGSEPDQVMDTPSFRVESDPVAAGDWYFRSRVVDRAGNWSPSSAALGPFRIETTQGAQPGSGPDPGPSAPPPPPLTPLPIVPVPRVPIINAFTISPWSVAVGGQVTLTFDLADAGTVTLRAERAAAGRRVGGRCLRPTRARRRRSACTRWVRVAGFNTIALQAGPSTITVPLSIGGRPLSRGRHRIVASAENAAGRSPERRALLRVREPAASRSTS